MFSAVKSFPSSVNCSWRNCWYVKLASIWPDTDPNKPDIAASPVPTPGIADPAIAAPTVPTAAFLRMVSEVTKAVPIIASD